MSVNARRSGCSRLLTEGLIKVNKQCDKSIDRGRIRASKLLDQLEEIRVTIAEEAFEIVENRDFRQFVDTVGQFAFSANRRRLAERLDRTLRACPFVLGSLNHPNQLSPYPLIPELLAKEFIVLGLRLGTVFLKRRAEVLL